MSLYDDASLIAYPSGYKEDKIYSIKPTDGSGDLTFSRASSATRVNEQGLIEESPVNKLTYSEDFSNAAWIKLNLSITANSSTSPDGTQNSTLVVPNATVGNRLIVNNTVNNLKTNSVFLKKKEIEYVKLGNASATVVVNLSNGTLSKSSDSTNDYSIESYGNEWYRVSIYNKTATSYQIQFFFGVDSSGANIATNGTDGLYIWGAQLNSGSTAKTYFPTTDRLNVPRIDYSNGCGSLLLEPQRTNLYLNSEPTANENASGNISYVTADFGLGFSNYVLFGDNSVARYRYGGTCAASTEYTISAFIKMDSGLTPMSGSAATDDFTFVVGGVVVSSGYVTQYFSNGIYRVSATVTSGTSNLGNNGILKYPYQTDNGFKVVGWQIEAGSYSTSYIISNSGTTTTRLADTSSTTGLSSVVNSTEGVLYAEISALADDGTSRDISINDGTSSNYVRISLSNASANIEYNVVVGGSTQASGLSAITQTDLNKIALKYKLNDFALWVNGVEVLTDSSGSTFSASTLTNLSYNRGTGVNPFYGNCQNLMVFPSVLTDEQLTDLTGTVQTSFNSLALSLGYTIL